MYMNIKHQFYRNGWYKCIPSFYASKRIQDVELALIGDSKCETFREQKNCIRVYAQNYKTNLCN